jgi:hypothetical protein
MKNIHILPTNKLIQNIYITSDEKPKHLDYYITKIKDSNGERYSVGQRLDTNDSDYSNCKKIILTTDQDLIKDGVQAIDDEFLEWFVKNPSCEEVETIHGLFNPMGRQVDPMNLGQNHSQCVWKYKITIPQEEPKKETVEEAAEKYVKSDLKKTPLYWLFHDTFKDGAKWQQEQDKNKYSEEEALELLRKAHFVEQNIEEWFEQFKKK